MTGYTAVIAYAAPIAYDGESGPAPPLALPRTRFALPVDVVQLDNGGSCTISTQYQGALLTKTGTDAWVVSGDVSAVA